jgi:broad specificity phosphatase PhoE
MTNQLLGSSELSGQLAAGICRLNLVRHGTTTLNVENRYRGRRDIPLDAQGYQDAVDAARCLSQVGLTAVYTSPLRRTIATAQIIADEARVPDLRILHGLNNVDYGAWEGLTAEEAAIFDPEAFALYQTSPSRAACPLGERLSDAQHRMMAALQLIASRHGGEAVAAVTHAVMIRLAFVEISGISDETWRRPVGRGSVTAFYAEGGKIWPVPSEQLDIAAEDPARLPAAQPGDGARREKAPV